LGLGEGRLKTDNQRVKPYCVVIEISGDGDDDDNDDDTFVSLWPLSATLILTEIVTLN
jgi:hypothetical protein